MNFDDLLKAAKKVNDNILERHEKNIQKYEKEYESVERYCSHLSDEKLEYQYNHSTGMYKRAAREELKKRHE